MFNFCPKCGSKYNHQDDPNALICQKCNYQFWQNSKPTASAFFFKDGKTLLGKRAVNPSKGDWDIIGGFTNLGEHPEKATIREVLEETGLIVEIKDFITIETDVYSEEKIHTCNIFYEVTIIGGQAKAGDDIEELKWFPINELPDNIAFQNGAIALKKWVKLKS